MKGGFAIGEGLKWIFNTIADLPEEICNGGKASNKTPAFLSPERTSTVHC